MQTRDDIFNTLRDALVELFELDVREVRSIDEVEAILQDLRRVAQKFPGDLRVDEGSVFEPLREDHPDDRGKDRGVVAGARAEVERRLLRRLGSARVDDD